LTSHLTGTPMAQLPLDKLDAVEGRFTLLEERMSANPDPDDFVRFSKEYAELQPVIGPIRDYRKAMSDLEGARELFSSKDRELREMAELEVDELNEKIERLVQEIRILLLPRD